METEDIKKKIIDHLFGYIPDDRLTEIKTITVQRVWHEGGHRDVYKFEVIVNLKEQWTEISMPPETTLKMINRVMEERKQLKDETIIS